MFFSELICELIIGLPGSWILDLFAWSAFLYTTVIGRVLYLFFCTRIKTCDCFFVFLPQSLPRAPASSRNKVYCWNLTESIVQTVTHQICVALLRDNSEWNIIFYIINLEMMKLEEENCPFLHSRLDLWNQHLTETLSSSRKPIIGIIWHPSMSRMIFEVALKLISSLPLSLRFWHPDTRLSIGKVNSNLKRRDFGSWGMKYILGQFLLLSTLPGTRKHIPPNGQFGKSSTQKCRLGLGMCDLSQKSALYSLNMFPTFGRFWW